MLLAQIWLLGVGLWAKFWLGVRAERSPAPGGWLGLIAVGTGPTLLSVILLLRPDMIPIVTALVPDTITAALPTLASVTDIPVRSHALDFGPALPLILWLVWLAGTAVMLSQLLWRTLWLHRLPVTVLMPDLALTRKAVPPHALGWPSSRVVVPEALWQSLDGSERAMLVAHERSHIIRRDPDVTLALLALQSAFWFNPGLRWLVSGWRQAAEMRADRAATADHNPRDYAQMFARLLRTPHGLPVPTATPPHISGDFIMRLDAILNDRPTRPRLFTTLALAILGCGAVAAAADTSPVDYPALVSNVPPVMPMHCLIDEEGAPTSILSEAAKATPDGRVLLENGIANVGWVNVSYDVAPDGSTQNISVMGSKSDCFHAASLKSVSQWRFETGKPVTGMETQLRFVMKFDAGEDYLAALRTLRAQTDAASADE
ncbi:hypothetical protein GCM10007854_17600 [Algimonas porphyrae]|uniref:TonB family protein n=2 Tax=Algimonas porphyrae TaxID=1128113 RepID=A0ABQ5UZU0_9PROT|nr:hypothetical protein GCM10007854_17600 [Algimonas porphyrae]